MNAAACPQCLENTMETFVDITVCVPFGWSNLSKSGIRKKEVKIVSADWSRARFYCKSCGWYKHNEAIVA